MTADPMKFDDVEVPERLVDFLYILARDHLPIGSIESIMWDQVNDGRDSYCNSYLEGYARNLAARLIGNGPITNWQHMYKSAGNAVGDHERYFIKADGTRTDAPYGSSGD